VSVRWERQKEEKREETKAEQKQTIELCSGDAKAGETSFRSGARDSSKFMGSLRHKNH